MNSGAESSLERLRNYYSYHARIYDFTRWSFLFGRDELIELIKQRTIANTILEVGCGTGKNLKKLAGQFPYAQIIGVDISAEMLNKAEAKLSPYSSRIELIEASYNEPLRNSLTNNIREVDLVVFSYSLSMINPGWENAIATAKSQLRSNGLLAVVDFDKSSHKLFCRWMARNHVRMDGHLAAFLQNNFSPVLINKRRAYAGLWEYQLFIGKKPAATSSLQQQLLKP